MKNNDESPVHYDNMAVSRSQTNPRFQSVVYQAGGVAYSGPSEPHSLMPGLVFNTDKTKITSADSFSEGALDSTVMIGFNSMDVAMETVASALMSLLTHEQLETVMSNVSRLVLENTMTGVKSMIHQDIAREISVEETVQSVDLEEVINQVLNQEDL